MTINLPEDLGFVITHTDDVCWTVCEKHVAGDNTKNPGKEYLRAVSHHGTLEDALQSVVRLAADKEDAIDTLGAYTRRIERVWADIKAYNS